MSATYKALSAILSYPSAELQDAAGELIMALNVEHLIPTVHRAAVAALAQDIADGDLLEAQCAYVDLFDRTRSLSLHLFEHVHGESRDRGQAMVSLLERYRQAGLDVAANELPDYIPLFLEFLALQTRAEACALLAESAHILAALGERLKKRGSAYSCAFEALVALSKIEPDARTLAELREETVENPHDLAALDRAWEETQVRFGPGDTASDSCPRVGDLLAKMGSDTPSNESEALRRMEQ